MYRTFSHRESRCTAHVIWRIQQLSYRTFDMWIPVVPHISDRASSIFYGTFYIRVVHRTFSYKESSCTAYFMNGIWLYHTFYLRVRLYRICLYWILVVPHICVLNFSCTRDYRTFCAGFTFQASDWVSTTRARRGFFAGVSEGSQHSRTKSEDPCCRVFCFQLRRMSWKLIRVLLIFRMRLCK